MPKVITDAQILDAAIEVLLERGYSGATTRQLAEAADISEMTLFRRFGTKARLAAAAVAHVLQYEKMDVEYTGDVEADLVRVLSHYHRDGLSRHYRLMPLLMLEIPRHPELSEILQSPFAQVSKVAALLLRYQEEGVLRRESPFHAVASVVGPLLILRLLNDAAPEKKIPPLDLEQQVQTYLHGRLLR